MRAYALLAVCAFVLHILWERSHIALYTGYETMKGVLPVYLFATLGDVAYTLGAVVLIALFKGSWTWFREPQLRDFAGLAILGLSIALFVEYKALALGRWEYTDAMPLLGVIGVSPLMQMTILLPLSVFLVAVVERRLRGTLGA